MKKYVTNIIRYAPLVLIFLVAFTAKKLYSQTYAIDVSPAKINIIAEPGQTQTQIFKIGNYSGEKRTLYLYTEDFSVLDEKGTPIFYEEPIEANERYSLTKWLELPFESIEVENNEVVDVEVKINIPGNAEAGGHYAAFFVQTEKPEITGTAIGSVGRIGSLMLVNVPGEVEEEIVFSQIYTDKGIYWEKDPTITLVTLLENKGSVHGIPTGAFNVTGGLLTFYNKSVIYNQKQGAVLPNAPAREITEEFQITKKGVIPPIGKFDLELIARYGTQNYPLEATISFWMLPVVFIIQVLAITFVLIFVIWRAAVSFKKK